MSGLASAASLPELRRHEIPALNALGIAACAGETLIGAKIELDDRPASAPLKTGESGWLTRIGGVLSGPLSLTLRLLAGMSKKQSKWEATPRRGNLLHSRVRAYPHRVGQRRKSIGSGSAIGIDRRPIE
jgi:hypothetical protein